MMGESLPPGVALVERGDDDDSSFLLPEERVQVAKAVERGVREFTTARSSAR
jgi:hypothetical protein